jgi:hypothetical protein
MTAEINRQFSTLNVLRKLGCGWIHEVREGTIRSLTFADGREVHAACRLRRGTPVNAAEVVRRQYLGENAARGLFQQPALTASRSEERKSRAADTRHPSTYHDARSRLRHGDSLLPSSHGRQYCIRLEGHRALPLRYDGAGHSWCRVQNGGVW